ncbi:MAG: hypothetical protein Q8P02_04150, partial [Candidatus Micrarchaeota archaeon]|nr:hypothetical protein [Candidatus Micrarchaeota archaeon]
MNFWQHIIVSLLAVAAVNAALGIGISPVLLAAALLGAMLPDADHAQTRIFRFLLFAMALAAGAGAYYLVKGDAVLKIVSAAIAARAVAGAVFVATPGVSIGG